MNVQEMKIEDLTPYEKNPRNNDEAVKSVAASIKEFGFNVPIVVDKENVVVAGHTRLKAAKELGLKTVPVIVKDDLTPKQIRAFRIADNKAGEVATWNQTMLAEEIKDLLPDFDFTQFGFADFEISVLDGSFEYEPYDKEFEEQFDEYSQEMLKNKRVVIVYTDEQEEDVKKLLHLKEIKGVKVDMTEILKNIEEEKNGTSRKD